MRLGILTSLAVLALTSSCSPVPKGSGPQPSDILVISTTDTDLSALVRAMEGIEPRLDPVIDKKAETIEVGGSRIPRFPYFEVALWYPLKGSNYYGVAITKWIPGAPETDNQFLIDVYTEGKVCALCERVKATLNEAKIPFYSACTSSRATKRESSNCRT
jgi:hypothetical protein